MRYSIVLSLVVAVLAVAFALVNNEPVTVHLGVTTVQNQSLALVILVSLFAGVLVGILASLPGRYRAKKRARSLERELRSLRESREGDTTEAGQKFESGSPGSDRS